ncbi:hypothetical protein AHAS_Ahas02G0154300 [Arachis hypogaea]
MEVLKLYFALQLILKGLKRSFSILLEVEASETFFKEKVDPEDERLSPKHWATASSTFFDLKGEAITGLCPSGFSVYNKFCITHWASFLEEYWASAIDEYRGACLGCVGMARSIDHDWGRSISSHLMSLGIMTLAFVIFVSNKVVSRSWYLRRTLELQGLRMLICDHFLSSDPYNLIVEGHLRETDFYHLETHTFYFPVSECAVSLEDVAIILGLPTNGIPVTKPTMSSFETLEVECLHHFGVTPRKTDCKGSFIKLTWIRGLKDRIVLTDDIQCKVISYVYSMM